MVSVILTDQSRLFWEWLHHKDIREGLQGFFFSLKLATQIVRKALPKTSLAGGKFWCGSDRVQKRNQLIGKSTV